MQGRLNIFQKTMVQWNEMHPYNAVHVARIPGPLELDKLKAAIATILEQQGLTGLSLDRRAGTYEYRGGAASAELKVVSGEGGPAGGFAAEIEWQLNTAFVQSDGFTPFRFFVLVEGNTFLLGLVYLHAMADAVCIVMLLKEILAAYRGQRSAPGPAFERYPAPAGTLSLRLGAMARKLVVLPARIQAVRRTSRPPHAAAQDLANRCVVVSLSPEISRRRAKAAKELGVTQNDLWLALLMQAISQWVPERSGRRRGIALGCIVNTRKDLGLQGKPVFGLFLGSFVVHHAAPPEISLAVLAREIERQTRMIKRNRLYLGTGLELAFGQLMSSFYSEGRRRKFYQKHHPLWGGISNMNLNSFWTPDEHETMPLDYFRAVSTGPVTPLVLSVTTFGTRTNLGLTYRPDVIPASEIERIQSRLQEPGTPMLVCT